MTVQDICQAVRWCYDEEALNETALTSSSGGTEQLLTDDNTLMNNIIKAKIGDALRWVCLYAPAEMLSGGDDEADVDVTVLEDDEGNVPADGRISLGTGFLRLVRVRCTGWHRAISHESLLKEDYEEYMQLMDTNGATATVDRPQAALIEKKVKDVEVWPHATGSTYELTKIVMPSIDDLSSLDDDSTIGVPQLLKPSFIYYIAFLVLSAYEDSRAPRMLEIAKMNIGLSDDKQRA